VKWHGNFQDYSRYIVFFYRVLNCAVQTFTSKLGEFWIVQQYLNNMTWKFPWIFRVSIFIYRNISTFFVQLYILPHFFLNTIWLAQPAQADVKLSHHERLMTDRSLGQVFNQLTNHRNTCVLLLISPRLQVMCRQNPISCSLFGYSTPLKVCLVQLTLIQNQNHKQVLLNTNLMALILFHMTICTNRVIHHNSKQDLAEMPSANGRWLDTIGYVLKRILVATSAHKLSKNLNI
jgi:hypothetical protein